MARLFALLIGYLCGCFLTAELVARRRTGRSASALGTGNPGMANIGAQLGRRWGVLVLLGDIAKTALACAVCYALFSPALGRLSVLYAGLGAALGHNFPFWKGFQGGKGVAVTCASLILYAPLWGVLCGGVGLGITLLTGYLPVGAVAIPALFLLPAFAFCGPEAGVLALLTALLMLSRHIRGLLRVARGQEGRLGRHRAH